MGEPAGESDSQEGLKRMTERRDISEGHRKGYRHFPNEISPRKTDKVKDWGPENVEAPSPRVL